MLTHAMLLQMLIEAEARRDDTTLPADVSERSAETVGLCKQRMEIEGLTRDQLEELAETRA
jgi:hypothetical protein